MTRDTKETQTNIKKMLVGVGVIMLFGIVALFITIRFLPKPAFKIVPSNQPAIPLASSSPTSITSDCDQSLWNHVYFKSRLRVVDQCKTVTGTIESIKTEEDGDYHIRLRLDQRFLNLVNQANIKDQKGALILETVCAQKPNKSYAQVACRDFQNPITVPVVGTHAKVTGSYVLDIVHGWMEIHPVSKIEILP